MGDPDNSSYPLTMQQAPEAQMAQQQMQSPFGFLGNALGAWSGGYSGTGSIPQQPPYDKLYNAFEVKHQSSRMLNFFRINEQVDIKESNVMEGKFAEPLDELRLKVAMWLYN